jgi:predicted acylesterase/phospholipase RssA
MAYVCRVPLFFGLVVFLAGLLEEQIQEVVRVHLLDVADAGNSGTVLSNLGSIYIGLFLLGWTQLFWGRYALANRYPPALAHNRVLRGALALLPIVLALLPWLGAAIAMSKAGSALQGDSQALAQVLTWVVVLTGVASIAAYHTKRRQLSIRHHRDSIDTSGVVVFGQGDWIVVSLSLGVVIFVTAAVAPQFVGRWLGSIAILLAACVALVPALTWLTTAPRLPRWHWLTLLLGLAVLWSALDLNDNHALRELPARNEAPKTVAYGEALRQWLVARVPPGSTEPYPVVFVAAEGGGIRAAYFTAQVLSAIQDRCPAFAQHLFVISGVSGGSIGAATFAGLLDASEATDAKASLRCSDELAGPGDFAVKSEAVLKADYLGPLIATFLFPDAFQRFLPFRVAAWDRARTLEETVELSFKERVGTDFMERSLYGYWKANRNVPVLMFNATNVESGHRTVASPAYALEERFHRLTTFYDFRPYGDFRISTMAVTSARFPLVTPAATLGTGSSKLRFVDGGYFENSGAVTLAEAVDVAMQTSAQYKILIRPIVIRIGNSPSMLAATEKVSASDEAQEQDWKGLGELLSPARAMVNTRSARGVLAAETLKTVVTTMQENGRLSDYVEFQIGVDSIPIPLGWQLASTTRSALVAQLNRPTDCSSRHGIVNGCSVVDVVDAIRSWRQH